MQETEKSSSSGKVVGDCLSKEFVGGGQLTIVPKFAAVANSVGGTAIWIETSRSRGGCRYDGFVTSTFSPPFFPFSFTSWGFSLLFSKAYQDSDPMRVALQTKEVWCRLGRYCGQNAKKESSETHRRRSPFPATRVLWGL